MKYDFQLDLGDNTSTGKMIAAIKDNSKILEFGPGNGRMTEYLVKEKNCDVSIVEFDPELYKHVMTFSNDGYLGNIEEYKWCDHFQNQTFDYILFADVLEHLLHPEETLKQVRPFLKEEGRILITFPNLAHNAVLIDLFNNKLTWRPTGLLDATHKTFYTQAGFEKVFNEQQLFIAEEDYTFAPVETIEIGSEYRDLPKQIQYYFRTRPYGEVYQYFFSLSKKEIQNPIIHPLQNSNVEFPVRYIQKSAIEEKETTYVCNLYTKENEKVNVPIDAQTEKLKVVPRIWSGVLNIELRCSGQKLPIFETNALWQDGTTYAFGQGEPYIEFDVTNLQNQEVEVTLEFLYIGDLSYLEGKIISNAQYLNSRISSLENQIVELNNQNQEILEKNNDICERYYRSVINPTAKVLNQNFKPSPNSVVEKAIHYNIDAILNVNDHTTVVKGWGYDKQTKTSLSFFIPENEGSSFEVKTKGRPDVTEQYELMQHEQYGFEITIENYQFKKYLNVVVQRENQEELYIRVSDKQPKKKLLRRKAGFALSLLKSRGILNTVKYVGFRLKNKDMYASWIKRNEVYDVEAIKKEIQAFKFQPKISIVVPIYNVEEKWLNAAVNSLKNQFYSNWELCLADDCSSAEHIKPLLEKYAKEDSRIKVIFREKNGHISEATNSAITLATGDYISFMDNDDELSINALYEVVKALNEDESIDFIYSDEDKVTTDGQRFDPFFKPNWNPTLILGHNYITHYVVVKKELIEKVGYLNTEFNGSQDYDFVLRATEAANKIHHIPRILYHWRTIETSTALDPESKTYAYVAGKNTLRAAMERKQTAAKVTMTPNYGTYKIDYEYPTQPKVTIIPISNGGDIRVCVETYLNESSYQNIEILLFDRNMNKKIKKSSKVVYKSAKTINELASYATGEYLFFMNDTSVPKNKIWLEELLNYGRQPGVGIVGAKVVNQNDMILNAGVSLDKEDNSFIFEDRGVSNKTLGYYFRISLPRNVYAVTEEGLLIKKAHFEVVKGFDESLDAQLMGIELSLKVREQLGGTIVWEPYSVLTDLYNASRELNKAQTEQFLEETHLKQTEDPYSNPNRLDR